MTASRAAFWADRVTAAHRMVAAAEQYADNLRSRPVDPRDDLASTNIAKQIESALISRDAWAEYAHGAEQRFEQYANEEMVASDAAEMCPGPCGRPEWMCGCAEQLERRTRYDDLTLGRLDRLDRGMDVA